MLIDTYEDGEIGLQSRVHEYLEGGYVSYTVTILCLQSKNVVGATRIFRFENTKSRAIKYARACIHGGGW